MPEILSHLIWVVFPSGIFAVFAWVGTQFVFKPVREFFDTRVKVRQRTLLIWDIPEVHSIEPSERLQYYASLGPTRDALAELGVQLVSFDQSETMASWFVRKLGFKPAAAGIVIRTIAQQLGTTSEDRDANFRRLDTALKFKFDANWPFYNPYNPGPHKKKG